jgi:hypothetical protein
MIWSMETGESPETHLLMTASDVLGLLALCLGFAEKVLQYVAVAAGLDWQWVHGGEMVWSGDGRF